MQLSIDSRLNTYNKPIFRSGCNVKTVFVNGKGYGQNQFDIINQVAVALSVAIHENKLPETLLNKVKKFLPDIIPNVPTAVATSNMRRNRVNVLVGDDALLYKDNYRSSESREVQREIGSDLVKRILKRSGKKQITVYATGCSGNYKITDVTGVVKIEQ